MDASSNSAAEPILPPADVLKAMAAQVRAEFGPDVCGADMVSALTARECQDWLAGRAIPKRVDEEHFPKTQIMKSIPIDSHATRNRVRYVHLPAWFAIEEDGRLRLCDEAEAEEARRQLREP